MKDNNKQLEIKGQRFYTNQLPTTQEDNHFGVMDRFEIFNVFNHTKIFGKLIKYKDGTFGLFAGVNGLEKSILNNNEVVFIK